MPTLLVQMLLVQPAALIVLDRITGRGEGVGAASDDWSPTRSPSPPSSAWCWRRPAGGCRRALVSPLEMLAGAAIPLMLMSYGAALG